jgi:hypothetical protein
MTASLDELFSPIREQAYRTVMLVRDANEGRDVNIAAITATLEGTMAAAVQVLGAEAAYNAIQPLVDRMLSPAL